MKLYMMNLKRMPYKVVLTEGTLYLSLTRHHYPPTYPPQTTHILHHLEIEQDLACIVVLTSDLMLLSLWPPTWPFFICFVNCSPPVFLHRVVLSEDHTWWQRARPGQGLFSQPHLLRLRGRKMGVQERRCAVLPSGISSKRCWKLPSRPQQQHRHCFDLVERELEAYGGVPMLWWTHWRN